MLIIALTTSLAGCSAGEDVPEEPADNNVNQDINNPGYSAADSVFSINYDPEGSLDPFTDTNIYNDQLFSLMYEGLFALDKSLSPQPVLCETWETSDGIHYTITLKEGVTFHNGSALTAQDAAYSINEARSSSKYSSRLSCIQSCTAGEGLTLNITLYSANYRLPALLDTPIVAYGTAGSSTPPGTGPYSMGSGSLNAYTGYRQDVDLDTIYLVEVPDDELSQAFSERKIDLVCYDPAGVNSIYVHMLHETRYYQTTDLIYLGFNCQTGPASSQSLRQAVRCMVDRDYICIEILGSSVTAAPLILNPALDIYDEAWEEGSGYDREAFSSAMADAGISDSNGDGYYDTELRFIVNSDNPLKVSVAQRIARDLNNAGLQVDLSVLSWSAYLDALKAGNFHMYLGEAKLSADFDLSTLLSSGGSLNYGGYSDSDTDNMIDAFLAASNDGSAVQAAQDLCAQVLESSPIVPIAYKQYAVLTHIGVVSGAEPSMSGVFTGAAGWEFILE